MKTREKEVVIQNTILGHTTSLNELMESLMFNFEELNISALVLEMDFSEVRNKEAMSILNQMLDIYLELGPIEPLINFSYPQYRLVFKKLEMLEHERKYGRLHTFLAKALPKKRQYKRHESPLLQNNIIESQAPESNEDGGFTL